MGGQGDPGHTQAQKGSLQWRKQGHNTETGITSALPSVFLLIVSDAEPGWPLPLGHSRRREKTEAGNSVAT